MRRAPLGASFSIAAIAIGVMLLVFGSTSLALDARGPATLAVSALGLAAWIGGALTAWNRVPQQLPRDRSTIAR